MSEAKKNRYVAYFDMLGYKTATVRNPARAWESLKALQSCMQEILKIHIRILGKDIVLLNRIQAFILADSVLIFTGEDSEYDLVAILILTQELFAQGLYKCIPLRGAITYGEFFYNLDLKLFGGIPFIRAYELERRAEWSGIIVDAPVEEHYKKLDYLKTPAGTSLIIPWEMRLKGDVKEKMPVLDWVSPRKRNFRLRPPIQVEDYYLPFVNLFGEYKNLVPSVQAKYINTVEFINQML